MYYFSVMVIYNFCNIISAAVTNFNSAFIRNLGLMGCPYESAYLLS